MTEEKLSVVELTADIVAAYVSANKIAADELPALIASIHSTLNNIDAPPASETPAVSKASPAAIRKSISHGGLISFEDGRTYQSLKRHLSTRGLTPAQYREKWGLPSDYPVTSPAYSEKRSALAKALGLGQRSGATKTKAPGAKRGPKPKS